MKFELKWVLYALIGLAIVSGWASAARWKNNYLKLKTAQTSQVTQAQTVQQGQNVAASVDYQKSVVEQKIVYQDRVKEVVKYVQSPKSSDADCGAGDRVGDEFIRVYNNGSASQAPD